ncbi:MAG: thiamine pyrophosphate-binding protein [Alphaproteobacteria bacterium]|nr:thiamine pyrophosphate-binding protein [Alphaproteobacteria bacterium]
MKGGMEMNGGEALARAILAHSPGPIFGMGGFQLLPFYDAARRLGLKHHLVNDERCGAFAADAYAKVSGRVGLCDGTLGPGATNLVTGLIEALNAGSPVVALIGDTHRAHARKHMTQEAHQVEILRPACKELIRIETMERIPELVRRAFQIATTGRPGPVVLDVPEDVCHGTHTYDPDMFSANLRYARVPAIRCRPERGDLQRAVELLANSRRPIMLCGGGVHISGATAEIERFATEFLIPVAHTMSGKGAIACSHPLNAGLFGRYDRIANKLIDQSDCVFVVGCKLGEIATKRYSLGLEGKPIVHLDIEPDEFQRTIERAVVLWGDIKATIEDLTTALASVLPNPELNRLLDDFDSSFSRWKQRESFKERGPLLDKLEEVNRLFRHVRTEESPDEHRVARQEREVSAADVARQMTAWRKSTSARMTSSEVPISMSRLIHELNEAMPEDGILIADGGFAAHWAGLLYDTKRAGRGFVPDRGFASIGYGLPAAIGAKLAAPERRVVAITGDGGLNMALGELETARRMGLGFTLIVVNNAASGYVKALQHLMYGKGNYVSADLAETNYAAVAEAMGCQGIRVENPNDIVAALSTAATDAGRPTVLDVVVTRDPAKMLPGVDSRTAKVKAGDRVA